ncbi:MAG: PIG-L deacetylase family protein [Phycisphaerae bacterium]|nr:PIG-L deacetylase family protein [Tepidisphaeraceae bacterium]
MISPRAILLPAAQAARAFRARLIHRYWARVAGAPMALDDAPILVVAPHQDDETFGCGGLIALKRARGATVTVVFVTDGGASPATGGATPCPAVRAAEARAALEILGVPAASTHFLNLSDGHLSTLSPAERDVGVARLADVIRAAAPTSLCVPHARDCLPDHEATYHLAVGALERSGRAATLLQYPVWMAWLSSARALAACARGTARILTLPIHAAVEQKRTAIAKYASQLKTLPHGFVRRFYDASEVYFAPRDLPGSPDPSSRPATRRLDVVAFVPPAANPH